MIYNPASLREQCTIPASFGSGTAPRQLGGMSTQLRLCRAVSVWEDRELQASSVKLDQKNKPVISLLPHLQDIIIKVGLTMLISKWDKGRQPPWRVPFSTPQHHCASHPCRLKSPPQ